MQQFLKGVRYPVSKEALIRNAKDMGADEYVCSSLERLPEENFQAPDDVSKAIGDLPNPPSGQPFPVTDGNHFLAQSLQDSMAEIELCAIALDKTANPDIQQFAQKMIDDHSRMSHEVELLAARRNFFDLPRRENAGQSATERELSALSGQEFDKRFMEHNVKEHEKDIKVFRHYAEHIDDADINSFAEKGVRILSGHDEMAKRISEKL